MIHNQFEHLFGDKFNAERHCISSGWNHEFNMIRKDWGKAEELI